VRRHLTQTEAVSALRRGRAVEQLLESEPHAGRPTVRWLSVFGHEGAFIVSVHHVYDACDPGFVDVTEFAPVNDEEYVGEGVDVAREPDPERALRAACEHGAVPERWVNRGVVENEYAEAHGWT
jgi:hypothetical protein